MHKEAMKFKKGWVGQVFHRSYQKYQNRTMTLANRNLNFVMLKLPKVKEGRFIGIKVLLNCIMEPNLIHEIHRRVCKGRSLLGLTGTRFGTGLLIKNR